jgi:hypothetical protein
VKTRRALVAAAAGLAAGLVVAAAAMAVTDAGAAQNVAGGVLLGLVGSVGSSVLHSDGPRREG